MTNGLLHIKVSLDMNKTQAFIKELIDKDIITKDTALTPSMFEWVVETSDPDRIKLFPIKLKT